MPITTTGAIRELLTRCGEIKSHLVTINSVNDIWK